MASDGWFEQTPPLRHGLPEQDVVNEQNVPKKPAAQVHIGWLFVVTVHVAPLRHGAEAHAFPSDLKQIIENSHVTTLSYFIPVSQRLPEYPD